MFIGEFRQVPNGAAADGSSLLLTRIVSDIIIIYHFLMNSQRG